MLIIAVRVYGAVAGAVGRVLTFRSQHFSVVTVGTILLLKKLSSRMCIPMG